MASLPSETFLLRGLRIAQSAAFKAFVARAKYLLRRPVALFKLLREAAIRLKRYDSVREWSQEAQHQIQVLIRLISSYAKGQYKGISRKNIVLSIAALAYFVAPLDLVFDLLPVVGLADDFALLSWVLRNYQKEIETFQQWEDQHKQVIHIEALEE